MWWRSLRLTLEDLEQRNIRTLLERRLDYHQLLLASQPQGYELNKVHQRYQQEQRQLSKMLFPWLSLEDPGKQDDQAAVVALSQAWKAIWGDPNDPAVASRIEATATALRRINR